MPKKIVTFVSLNIVKSMIYLIFNVEEFSVPRKYSSPVPQQKQIEVSTRGTESVLEMLQGFGVKATFLCSELMAEHRPTLIKRIIAEGHRCIMGGKSYANSRTYIELNSSALRNIPLSIILLLADRAVRRDGSFTTSFCTWEFTEDCEFSSYRLPILARRNTGQKLIYLVGSLIVHFKEMNQEFVKHTDKMAEK